MLITRSPLRISLGGGGTDLPSYYEKHGGFVMAGAIDKYIYLTVHKIFRKEYIIKYSKIETVKNTDKIKHPIIREVMSNFDLTDDYIEVISMADIPAGCGLGSSGSFTCALIKALNAHKRNSINPEDLAQMACEIEIDDLKEPVGKQDQYISSYGGLTCFEFKTDNTVQMKPLKISNEILNDLEDNLLLFFTGYSRQASSILKEQHEKSLNDNNEMIDNLHFIKELAYKSMDALEAGKLSDFAHVMNLHWQHKKKRSTYMSNSKIDLWYQKALDNGALGGKLIGAGGGGFLMFYTEDHAKLRKAMNEQGLMEVRFRFDFEGSKVII